MTEDMFATVGDTAAQPGNTAIGARHTAIGPDDAPTRAASTRTGVAPARRRSGRRASAAVAAATAAVLLGVGLVGTEPGWRGVAGPARGNEPAATSDGDDPATASGELAMAAPATAGGERWVATWATAMAVPVSGQPLAGFTDVTLRQRIHVSIGGDIVRLRLTNRYGRAPLVVRSVNLARPGAAPGELDPASVTPVTFAGSADVTVPAGAELVSDPVRISVPDDGDLLASFYLPGPTGPATHHRTAHSTGYVASGDHAADPTVAAFGDRTTSFWFLDGLDVRTRVAGAVVFLGDSITDGDRSTMDADHRWPDYLADRMLAAPRPYRFGVVNAGIAGNRLLLDHTSFGGVNALARLEHDVLTQTGARTVVVFEGVNDIQNTPTQYDPQQFVLAYRQIISRCREAGLRVVGATIAPFAGWSSWTPEREAVRVAVNRWIRGSGEFDAVLDFDAVLRDPAQPQRLLPAYDSGDHLHPGDAGYAAMAAAVDLRLLRP